MLICGLPSACESEGFDRTHLGLPAQMVELIEAVAAGGLPYPPLYLLSHPLPYPLPFPLPYRNPNPDPVAPRLVVVLLNGSPVEMPWVGRVPAVLAMGLGGQAMG